MRLSRLACYITVASLCLPLLAGAQTPVVFLQFGSYESKKEASEKLKELAAKHVGILGSLPVSVREVAISDDLTVYRTQAGPVKDRSTGQSICAQLASNGDECYIVETAIQAAMPSPAGAPPLAPSLTTSAKALADDAKAAAEPITEAAREVRNGGPSNGSVRIERDAENVATLAKLGEAPESVSLNEGTKASVQRAAALPADAAAAMAKTAPAGDMESALEEAAASAPSAAMPDQPAKIAASKPESSFWDSINPFSGSDDDAPKPKAVVAAPKPVETAVEPVEQAALASPQPAPEPAAAPAQEFTPPPPVLAPPAPPQEAAPQPTEQSAFAITPPDNAPMDLPPPPLPANAQQRDAMAAEISRAQQLELNSPPSYGTPVAAPEPVAATPLAAPNFKAGTSIRDAAKQTPQGTPAAEEGPSVLSAVVPGSGTVQVEEAQRVPVSEDKKPVEPAIVPVVAQSAPENVPVASTPSNSVLVKSLWAQMGTFDTPQLALKFWDSFRKQNPDFPVVRVRVTTSYIARQAGVGKYSLRIGPFGNGKFIGKLCDSDEVSEASLECLQVNDMGVSANASLSAADQPPGYRPGRYGRGGHGIAPLNGFWVQLGAFPTMDLAKKRWDDLKKDYDSVLSSMQAQVSTPPMGSQATQVYRLRAGPFVSQSAAEETCVRLIKEKASCLVVAENDL